MDLKNQTDVACCKNHGKMRYTTIIDISTIGAIYRNHNCRLIYLHMVLKSGYHDNDRDLIEISIRTLAAEVGLTISATRHALGILTRAKLVERQGELWYVKKWLIEENMTPRPKTRKEAKERAQTDLRQAADQRREQEADNIRRHREELRQIGKTDFMIWYEQKIKAAADGDVDAQRSVERNKAVYERHKADMEQQQGGHKK